MIDLGNIYIKKKVTSGKILTLVPAKSSAVGSASRRRTKETWSCKKLMRVRLVCRSIKSGPWAVKKASVQSGLMYDKGRMVVAISKSFFLLEEQKRGISRGYCRDIRPNRMYWAGGPIRRHLISPRMDKHGIEVSTNK